MSADDDALWVMSEEDRDRCREDMARAISADLKLMHPVRPSARMKERISFGAGTWSIFRIVVGVLAMIQVLDWMSDHDAPVYIVVALFVLIFAI